MTDLGPYAAFILAAYGVAILVLAGLAAWVVLEGRRQRRRLQALHASGLKRRAEP